VLFQGDLLRVNEPGGAAFAPAAAADLSRLIRRLGIAPTIIGAVHGRNATMSDLQVAVAARPKP
jgi:hypothetical protein